MQPFSVMVFIATMEQELCRTRAASCTTQDSLCSLSSSMSSPRESFLLNNKCVPAAQNGHEYPYQNPERI